MIYDNLSISQKVEQLIVYDNLSIFLESGASYD